ncbi:hypothetical protein [Natronomonas marina]|jgi:phage shock protein PspC (stress-responsive transcriptional regulator)|uniref:hypothetical protein n=1 Tax=Natronomonas marina TaxID=2961939 RepID=UPI0020C98EBF|nr:hypothetical protein [Natronomonas marina]
MTTDTDSHAASGIPGRIGRYVNHDAVLVRFVSIWVVVATLFTVAWVGSYLLLPRGVLRGGNPVASMEYVGSVPREFLTLFAWNVGVSIVAIGANTLRSVNTPLGYVMLAVQAPGYGAVWGTGSLAVGTGARVVPSLAVLVERSGPLEITAMVAVVVATRGVMLWHQRAGPRWREEFERVRSPRDWSLKRSEWALLVGGYLLLAVANYREALAIAAIAG